MAFPGLLISIRLLHTVLILTSALKGKQNQRSITGYIYILIGMGKNTHHSFSHDFAFCLLKIYIYESCKNMTVSAAISGPVVYICAVINQAGMLSKSNFFLLLIGTE